MQILYLHGDKEIRSRAIGVGFDGIAEKGEGKIAERDEP